jgi:predicted flap endonuclease-1-like 5' DNA nuclease
MNLLFRIVYAAHASGTHHKLALDTLRHLQVMDADLWRNLFLANAKLYLEGSKAPDTEFKDFKNHVLHTRDGYWGGAPEKVGSWYHHLVEALSQQDWHTAVYCAGVLSHYYTDPLMPFHTAQSEAENNIHRAVEWSISRSYDALAAQGEREFRRIDVSLPPGPGWLATLVCRGAEKANASYEKLIAHYDFRRGVVDPPAGLDRVAQRLIAELIRYAAISYAAVLDRAIEESNAHAPDVALTPATLIAAAQVPFKLIARRIADAGERRLVERIYDELVATGTVEQNLPEDDRAVRGLYQREVLANRAPPPQVSSVFPFKPKARVVTRIERQRAAADTTAASNVVSLRAAPPPAERRAPVRAETEPNQMAEEATSRARPKAGLSERLERVTAPPARGEPRFYLSLDQDVVDGPSIGPKTAEKLYPHGIRTVRDLLRADPSVIAVLADARNITAEALADWQDQARLMCTVPGLRGTHAQLLVGAGYRSADAIAAAEPDKLCADVLNFAASTPGQRVLRNGDPPDIEKIKAWLEAARSAQAA